MRGSVFVASLKPLAVLLGPPFITYNLLFTLEPYGNRNCERCGGEWGVLLLAHGAPDRLEDIPEFLLNVRSGRKLPEAAVNEIVRRYGLIGGSPLLRLSTLQAEGLAMPLGRPVYLGMRNWKPFISEAIRQINADGVERIVALCLAPQNSRTSIGLYKKVLFEDVERLAPDVQLDFIENWHDHPGLIEAFREKVATALARAQAEAGGPVPVIFTAHSVPEKTIQEGDPYERQVRETAALVAKALGLKEYCVAFQSQGMTSEPWIGPTVESLIDRLAVKRRSRSADLRLFTRVAGARWFCLRPRRDPLRY